MRAQLSLNAILVLFQRITQELTDTKTYHLSFGKETFFKNTHTYKVWCRLSIWGETDIFSSLRWCFNRHRWQLAGLVDRQADDEPMMEKAADHFGSKRLSGLYC